MIQTNSITDNVVPLFGTIKPTTAERKNRPSATDLSRPEQFKFEVDSRNEQKPYLDYLAWINIEETAKRIAHEIFAVIVTSPQQEIANNGDINLNISPSLQLSCDSKYEKVSAKITVTHQTKTDNVFTLAGEQPPEKQTTQSVKVEIDSQSVLVLWETLGANQKAVRKEGFYADIQQAVLCSDKIVSVSPQIFLQWLAGCEQPISQVPGNSHLLLRKKGRRGLKSFAPIINNPSLLQQISSKISAANEDLEQSFD